MDIINALDVIRQVRPIYEWSQFGEALDTICKTIESCQLPIIKQVSEPLQEIAALVKCYDECKDCDGFYCECSEIVDRMRQLLPC